MSRNLWMPIYRPFHFLLLPNSSRLNILCLEFFKVCCRFYSLLFNFVTHHCLIDFSLRLHACCCLKKYILAFSWGRFHEIFINFNWFCTFNSWIHQLLDKKLRCLNEFLVKKKTNRIFFKYVLNQPLTVNKHTFFKMYQG